MAEKVLYILGAGASANSYPLARSVYLNFEIVKQGLAHALNNFDFAQLDMYRTNSTRADFFKKLETDFKTLAKNADLFGDVDTYAKYILIKEDYATFKSVKQTLAMYFSIQQSLLEISDSRYLSWLVSIMDRRRFPANVKVLSWNYDYQLQLAAQHFGDLEEVQHSSNSFIYSQSFLPHYPNLDPTSSKEELSLIHLNGIAGYVLRDSIFRESIFQRRFKENKETIVDFLASETDLHTHIHFAWEPGRQEELLDKVIPMIENTSIVVVIGYSFPFFNREIDKEIFRLLVQAGKLKKIYFQDPVLTGMQLRTQFEIAPHIDIQHISKTDNFHVPFEY